MDDGCLRVLPTDRPRGRHVAIDLFFRTLAHAHRERAIGVVLSGTGADGAAGIARIKEQGGLTLAQLPTDCEYEDMPRNAIASGTVDFVLPVAEMGRKILDVWHNARNISLPDADLAAALPVLSHDGRLEAETAFREIVDVLSRRTGHDFTHYKRATVLRRIERRLQVRLLKDLPTYNEYLRDNPAETSDFWPTCSLASPILPRPRSVRSARTRHYSIARRKRRRVREIRYG